jgi:hypothetical protein
MEAMAAPDVNRAAPWGNRSHASASATATMENASGKTNVPDRTSAAVSSNAKRVTEIGAQHTPPAPIAKFPVLQP